MHMWRRNIVQRSSWQTAVLSLFAALSVAVVAVVPAVAATHPQGKGVEHKAAKKALAKKCAKRNKATGEIRWSDWQFPTTLNQYQTSASVATENYDNITEGLVFNTDSKGAVVPDILAKIPTVKNGGIRNGGKLVRLFLKHGAHWSNGTEITAADVKFAWKVQMTKISGPNCLATCDSIGSISTRGKYEADLHMKRIYGPLISYGLPAVWPTSWPGPHGWSRNNVKQAATRLFQDTGETFTDKSFPTNGAYQVTEFVPGNRIKYAPMKYYSTMSCGARVKTLVFAFFANKAAMIAAAASHQTDSSTDYTLGDLKALQGLARQGKFTFHNDPGFLFEHLTFNVDANYHGHKNPLHSQKVRVALALAVDKLGLIRSALGMNAAQAKSIEAWTPLINTARLKQPFVDRGMKGQWDPIRHKYLSNTGKGQALKDARTLLKQAGYNGGHFTVDAETTSGNPVRQAQFAVLTNNWRAIGVTVNAKYIPAGLFFSDWATGSPLNHGDFQVAQFTDVGYADPDTFRTSVLTAFIDRRHAVHNAIYGNFGGISDPVIERAFSNAAHTLNNSARQHWYNVWQIQMNKQAYWVDFYYRGAINTDDGHIGNYTTNPSNLGEEWNTWQWYPKGHR